MQGHTPLEHENAQAHTANETKFKFEEGEGLKVLPKSAYSPDLALLDYYSFHAIARRFNNMDGAENGCREIFASDPAKWYKGGIELLAKRWQ